MDFSSFLPFFDKYLNAYFFYICIFMVPFLLTIVSALKLKFATKSQLLLHGAALVVLSLLFAPLFSGTLDLISSYENKLERCYTEYVYKQSVGHEELTPCKDLSETQKKDLSNFKDFIIVISVFVSVIVLSLGVNLIASGISMSEDKLALEQLYKQVDEVKTSIEKQTNFLKILVGVSILSLAFTTWMFFTRG